MKSLYELRRSCLWTTHPTDSQQLLLPADFSPSTMSRFTNRISQTPFLLSIKLFNIIVALVAFSLLIWSGVNHGARNMVWFCKLTEA